MDSPARPVSHLRRFVIGLALASLLGVGVEAVLFAGARGAEIHQRAERRAVVTLAALTNLVEQAGGGASGSEPSELPEETAPESGGGMGLGDELAAVEQGQATPAADMGEAVRRAVARFAETHPEVTAIRVLKFEGITLEASTDPRDRGAAKQAPRRLAPDEKPFYDLGQKLRAAVEGGREGAEGAARQPEISVVRQPGGEIVLAAPVERGGEVVGMVQMETRTRRDPVSFD